MAKPTYDELVEALERLLKVAQAFEKQASKGTGGRRGGQEFVRVRSLIARARESDSHDADPHTGDDQ